MKLTAKNNLVTALLHFNKSRQVFESASALVGQLEALLSSKSDFKELSRPEQFKFFGVQHLEQDTLKLSKLLLSSYLNLILGARGLDPASQPRRALLIEAIKKGHQLAKLTLDDAFIAKFKHLLKVLLSEGLDLDRSSPSESPRKSSHKRAERVAIKTEIEPRALRPDKNRSQHVGKEYRLNAIKSSKPRKPESSLNNPRKARPYESKAIQSELIIPRLSRDLEHHTQKNQSFFIRTFSIAEPRQQVSLRHLHAAAERMTSLSSVFRRRGESRICSRDASVCSVPRSGQNSIEQHLAETPEHQSKGSNRSLSNSEEAADGPFKLQASLGASRSAAGCRPGPGPYSPSLAVRKSLFSKGKQRVATAFASKQEIPRLQQSTDTGDAPAETSISRTGLEPSQPRSSFEPATGDPKRAKLSKFYTRNKQTDIDKLHRADNTERQSPVKSDDHQILCLAAYEKLESSEEDNTEIHEAEEKTSLEQTVTKANCKTEGTGSSPVNLQNRQSLNTAKKTSEIGFTSVAAFTGFSHEQAGSQASLPKPKPKKVGENQAPYLLSSPDLKPAKKSSFHISSMPVSQNLPSRNTSGDKKNPISIHAPANPYFLKVVNRSLEPTATISEEQPDSPLKATVGCEVQLAEEFSSKEELAETLEDPAARPLADQLASLEGSRHQESHKNKLLDLINDLVSQNILLQNQLLQASNPDWPAAPVPASELLAGASATSPPETAGRPLPPPNSQGFLAIPKPHQSKKKRDFEKVGRLQSAKFLSSKNIGDSQSTLHLDSQTHIKLSDSRATARKSSAFHGPSAGLQKQVDEPGVVVSLAIPDHSPVSFDHAGQTKAVAAFKNALTVTRAANRIRSVRSTQAEDSSKHRKLLKPNSLVLDKEKMKENFKGDSVTVVRTHTIESFNETVCSFIKATYSEETRELCFEVSAYVSGAETAARRSGEERSASSMSVEKAVMSEREFFEAVCSLELAYIDTMPNTLLVNTSVEYLLRQLVARYLSITVDLQANSLRPQIARRPAAVLEIDGLGYLGHPHTARLVHNHDQRFWLVVSNSSSQRYAERHPECDSDSKSKSTTLPSASTSRPASASRRLQIFGCKSTSSSTRYLRDSS